MNPYRSIVRKGSAKVIPGFTKLPGQSGSVINASGELNASSKADLIAQIGRIITAASEGAFREEASSDEDIKRQRREAIAELQADTSGEAWKVMGEALATEIYETTNREGFVRRLTQYKEVGQGEINQVTIKEKQVIGVIATSPSQYMATEIRQRKLIPAEFHCGDYILIDTMELATATSDLLEEKYEEGLEAVMVQEDRLWKKMADMASGISNEKQYFSALSPAVFARMKNEIDRWGIPVTTCLFSTNLWTDVISNPDFAAVFDPVTQWELLQEGYLGMMYGVSIMTDNFRQPNLKVLEPGDIYMVGDPLHHGVLTMRGSMIAENINKFAEGESKKGWFMDEIISLVIGNSKSVVAGKKI